MNLTNSVTIVIPVRIESEERRRNLDIVVDFFVGIGIKVIVLEADVQQRYTCSNSLVEHIFIEDVNPLFHRTHYINLMLLRCDTPVVGVCDSDMILPASQVWESVESILNGFVLSYPYNRIMKNMSITESENYAKCRDISYLIEHSDDIYPVVTRPSYGGLFFVDREIYLQCGGENERFRGWGPEDAERVHRIMILGHRVHYSKIGPIFHLWHSRGRNSWFYNDSLAIETRGEFVKVCNMLPKELRRYIASRNS